MTIARNTALIAVNLLYSFAVYARKEVNFAQFSMMMVMLTMMMIVIYF